MFQVVAVILAGGGGTRLWPFSRQLFPKQFMKLNGDQSMLHVTAERLNPLVKAGDIWVVTGHTHVSGAGAQELQHFSCLLEPCARNTAPAVAAMASWLATQGDPLMLVLAADHQITDVSAFHQALQVAFQGAHAGNLVTFGICPTYPETGYGYIQAGAASPKTNLLSVTRFVEKPTRETAESMLAQGGYYWNSGMLCAKASVLLAEIHQHCPAITSVLNNMEDLRSHGHSFQESVDACFAAMPEISLDYAVLEKSSKVVVIPCEIGWSDVGSWDAVYDTTPKDADGNALKGRNIVMESHNNLVMGEGRLVALLGVSNLCVVDTPDALLVAQREQTQKVRQVVEALKSQQAEEHMLHRTLLRPWGSTTVLENAASHGYRIKRVEVQPGGRLSLQSHAHRSEHWVVVEGEATVTLADKIYALKAGESTFVPQGVPHRLENQGTAPLIVVEIQVGESPDEEDITRYDAPSLQKVL